MPDKEGITDLGGTLRLGSYPCILDEHSKAYQLYGHKQIEERHRHRYEVNNDYREVLQENGMMLSGFSPDGRIVRWLKFLSILGLLEHRHILSLNQDQISHILYLRDSWLLH
mgnify:FL=1